MVYKLVSRGGDSGGFVAVAKTLKEKLNVVGREFAVRRLDDSGTATHEVLFVGRPPADGESGRPLLHHFTAGREPLPGWTGPSAATRAQEWHAASMAELLRTVDRLEPGGRLSRLFTNE